MRYLLALFAVIVAIGTFLQFTASVSAHADYESSTPARGEQLAVAPTEVEITFTQELQKIAGSYEITVNKDRGLSATSGPAVVNDTDRTRMSVVLQPNLQDGRYVVNWKNLSDADGDRNAGAFSFYLNHVPTAVDLANDAALEQIGPTDETPPSGQTPASTQSPVQTSEPSPGAGTETSDPTPLATPGDDASGGGDSNAVLFVVIAVVAVVAVVGGAFALRSRSS